MGVLGCPNIYELGHNYDVNELFVTSFCINCFYHGIDWIYSSVETIYAFDFRVWYF